MTIGIDIGNSRVKCAAFNDEGAIVRREILPSKCDDESVFVSRIRAFCGDETRIAVTNVVRSYSHLFGIGGAFEDVFLVTEDVLLPFKINYEKGMLGTDRIAAAAYASIIVPGANILVVDAGTALTFGVILSEGVFDGGLITAGAVTAVDALSREAPALGHISFGVADNLVAHNTRDALRSGFFNGYSSMVEGILSRIAKQYNCRFSLVITGGGAAVLSHGLTVPYLREDDLVMKGINHLFCINRVGKR